MPLGPDSWCLPGDWPRHKLRAYGRLTGVPGGAEYRRLLNFLSKNAALGERELLNVTSVPQFAQVPSIVNRRIRSASESSVPSGNRLKSFTQADANSSGSWTINQRAEFAPAEIAHQQPVYSTPQPIQELFSGPVPQPLDQLREPPCFEPPITPAPFARLSAALKSQGPADLLDFAPCSDIEMSITFEPMSSDYVEEAMQTDFAVSINDHDFSVGDDASSVNDFLTSLTASQVRCEPTLLNPDVPANIVQRVAAEAKTEDNEFVSHLSVLLNEWFDKEHAEPPEDLKPAPRGLETPEMRRERIYALLKKPVEKLESKRLMQKLGDAFEVSEPRSRRDAGATDARSGLPAEDGRSKAGRIPGPGTSIQSNASVNLSADPSLDFSGLDNRAVPRPACAGKTSRSTPSEARRRNRNREAHETTRHVSFLPNGIRKEESGDGSFILKDAVGRVTEARSHDGVIMSFSYDNRGHLKSFVRSDVTGKIHTTGVKDKHGVIVRDEHGSLRAQGDSMTVDTNGCVSIRKFDGQFWSLDVQRGIHIERRILEDVNGNWNCLTALLTCDGFRMVTRFQKLQENKRESYRKYGDWLGSSECSKFRFYGRDGSMIEFENDEDLEALRPSRIWSAGTRSVDREWIGRRQAGTAWDAVHRYVSQYLSAL